LLTFPYMSKSSSLPELNWCHALICFDLIMSISNLKNSDFHTLFF
jgi:hypothetical protein